MGECLAKLSLVLILVGAHLTFLPMFLAGLEGQPVDVYKYFDTGNLDLYNLLCDDRRLRAGRRDHRLAGRTPRSASAPGSAPAPTPGAATASSGSRSRRRRRTTSTSSPTSAAPSRCATSATPSRRREAAVGPAKAESGEPVA